MYSDQTLPFLPPKNNRARGLAIALLCLAPIAFGLLALYLGQDANWDLRNYHYYNAYAFLNHRYALDLLPSQTPYFYNPLMDVPFFLLATHVPAKVAGFALGFVQGFNFILLFMIAHAVLIIPNKRQKVIVSAVLAALGMLGGGGIAQIGTTFGDNITSIGTLLSAALVVRYLDRLREGGMKQAFMLALAFGMPVGLMFGLKLPAVVYAVGLCGALLFCGGGWKRGFWLSFAFGIGVLTGCAATLTYWALFLNANFGSPLFPYFNNLFKSDLAPLTSARDIQYAPHSLSDYFMMPFLFAESPFRVGEIEWRDWRLTLLYVLLPIGVLLRLGYGRNKKAEDAIATSYGTRYLLTAFALAYVAWLVMFSIYRYAVTLEMVAPLLLVLTVGLAPVKNVERRVAIGFFLLLIAGSVKAGNWYRRADWLDGPFVQAQIPALGDTSNLMIVMAGFEPYSHLVPLFPPEIRFVRIQSNFASPDQNKGINKLLHERVDAHKAANGRFLMLIPSWQIGVGSEALSYFGLKLNAKDCQNVTDRLFDDKQMSLCPVTQK